jgi:hypothetical protein
LGASEDDGEDDLAAREIQHFDKFWGWFGTLISLANEDITKIDEITKYPLMFVLNYLSYQKDKNEIIQRERQKIQMSQKRF